MPTPARYAARAWVRHPVDIPIEIAVEHAADRAGRRLSDVGVGGLAFESDLAFAVGSTVRVRIAVVRPPFETCARVIWCRAHEPRFDIGLQFVSAEAAFTVRMVEQVCHIEHYRKEVWPSEGRHLDPEEAAREWVDNYAADFPGPWSA